MTLKCTETGKSNVSSLPQCVKVSCGAPNDILNGKVNANAFTYQENATYTCDEGYELEGTEIITCLSTRCVDNHFILFDVCANLKCKK